MLQQDWLRDTSSPGPELPFSTRPGPALWAQSAGTPRPLVASSLVPQRTPGGADVQSRQDSPVSLSSGQPDPSPCPVWGLVDSGHWSCWGGLACPQPPHVAWFWFLITPVIALSLSPSPLQFCACRCSFPSFEQSCVVLHFIFF